MHAKFKNVKKAQINLAKNDGIVFDEVIKKQTLTPNCFPDLVYTSISRSYPLIAYSISNRY